MLMTIARDGQLLRRWSRWHIVHTLLLAQYLDQLGRHLDKTGALELIVDDAVVRRHERRDHGLQLQREPI
jgi:hypothetical protein